MTTAEHRIAAIDLNAYRRQRIAGSKLVVMAENAGLDNDGPYRRREYCRKGVCCGGLYMYPYKQQRVKFY